ncbi:MAG: hypothetical protein GVY36_19955 [Verrucomicrobia bacterium]|jgi:hypothetical protein|nr:hypothetical protein [Verrucomicrobiota bacterium]
MTTIPVQFKGLGPQLIRLSTITDQQLGMVFASNASRKVSESNAGIAQAVRLELYMALTLPKKRAFCG